LKVSFPSAAVRGADIIHQSFDDYHTRFRSITRRTKERFERCDWDGVRRDTVKRLGIHPQAIAEAFELLEEPLGDQIEDHDLWAEMKDAYSLAILGRDDFELAQTFFNSLSRRVFPHFGVDPEIDFVSDDFPLPYKGWEMASARMYAANRIDSGVVRRILEDAKFLVPFGDLRSDSELAANVIGNSIEEIFGTAEVEAIDVLRPVFIRNKAAYVIGRIRVGDSVAPLIFAVLNEDGKLYIDAVLTKEEEASVVFSFARWYFHADISSPREVIGFLHTVLPKKRLAELYVSLGYHKHGKTEFYRDVMRFMATSDEKFVIAPGQRGLVMSVFTLPSYQFVFKVIKDFFPPSKRITHRQVKQKYREVLRHDRVGRLVDFQEFEHLEFRLDRFDPELLDELLREATATVCVEGRNVVIKHLYIGRRVTPLDIYLGEASREEAEAAVIDWGFAIKDLAAANIFSGDMLLKNFGVTRHNRVVFYDYDELCPLGQCNFRSMPVSRSFEDELSAEPWFSVSESDVFPEELSTFLELGGALRQSFDQKHADLFDVKFWSELQERNLRGEVIDFYPYSLEQRLAPASDTRETAAPLRTT
jgi:isocitrate dehydrogenase kinase/phosphatase